MPAAITEIPYRKNFDLVIKDGRLKAVLSEKRQNGDNKERTIGYAFLGREEAWHKLGSVQGATLRDARNAVDPERRMDEFMRPLYVPTGSGDMQMTGAAAILRDSLEEDAGIGDFVQIGQVNDTGLNSDEEWQSYNPDAINGRYHNSANFDVVNATHVVNALDEVLVDEQGNRIILESFGFLGENGADGFFFSIELPEWDARLARRLGTNVEQYLTVFVHPSDKIAAFVAPTVVVCQNTLALALHQTQQIVHINHRPGARERLRHAVHDMYSNALQSSRMQQDMVSFMLTLEMNDDQFAEMSMYLNPELTDPREKTIRGTMTLEDKVYAYERRMESRAREIETMNILWASPEKFGEWTGVVTGEVRNTAFAGIQVVSALQTKSPFNNSATYVRDITNGQRALKIDRASQYVLASAVIEGRSVPEGFVPDSKTVKDVHSHQLQMRMSVN